MATQWFSNMVMEEPSFFHQWQSDATLEQYTEQQIAVAFGQAELDHATAAAALMQQQQQQYGVEQHQRPRKSARLRRPVEAAVLVKKSQLVPEEDDGSSSSCDENFEGAAEAGGLPEIEARMSDRTVLVKIHCENRKGALIAALSQVEGFGLTIMNTNVLPFTASSLDITIMATAGEDFSLSVKDIVRKLNQAFKSSSP